MYLQIYKKLMLELRFTYIKVTIFNYSVMSKWVNAMTGLYKLIRSSTNCLKFAKPQNNRLSIAINVSSTETF